MIEIVQIITAVLVIVVYVVGMMMVSSLLETADCSPRTLDVPSGRKLRTPLAAKHSVFSCFSLHVVSHRMILVLQ